VNLANQVHLALMFRKHGTIPLFLISWCVIKHSDSLMVCTSTTLHVFYYFQQLPLSLSIGQMLNHDFHNFYY